MGSNPTPSAIARAMCCIRHRRRRGRSEIVRRSVAAGAKVPKPGEPRGAGNDHLFAGGAGDILTGGAGTDDLHGGSGNDTFHVTGTSDTFDTFDTFAGGGGTDTLKLMSATTLNGFDSVGDSIEAIATTGTKAMGITGTAASETFDLSHVSSVTGTFFVDGGAGNDTITGSDAWNGDLRGNIGNDTLIGAGGNDKLIGGAGNDTMTGNGGADVFWFDSGFGQDAITDFAIGTDHVSFANSMKNAINATNPVQDGNDVVFTIGTTSLTFENHLVAGFTGNSDIVLFH